MSSADGSLTTAVALLRMPTDDFRQHVDRLKAAVSGVDLAADLGLVHRGRRYFCPACQPTGGKTPDLAVNDDGFRCFKCGASGDVIDLVVFAKGLSKADAIRWMEDRTGLERPRRRLPSGTMSKPSSSGITAPRAARTADFATTGHRTPSPGSGHFWTGRTTRLSTIDQAVVDLYAAFLTTVCRPLAGTPGADYLVKRGLDIAVADRVGVRYCPDLSPVWSLADRAALKAAGLSTFYAFQKLELPVLVFPYIYRGQPVFLKARTLLGKAEADRREIPRFLNTGGTVPCLWNHDAIADADRVLICEGEIDALTAIVAGQVGVGLPGWSHWKDAWLADFAGKDVVLVLDADDAGRKGMRLVAQSFLRGGLPVPRQLQLEDGKDLNDTFQDGMKGGE